MSAPAATTTAFERRRRRVRIHRRDLVGFRSENAPDLQARLDRLEIDLIAAVRGRDPEVDSYLEWYGDEARKYGLQIRPGLSALYWLWGREKEGETLLNEFTYEEWRDRLASGIPGEFLDGNFCTGRTILQEFIWWSAGDWIFAEHLLHSIVEYRAYSSAGKMPDWRRRKRRRLAAAARKSAREARAAFASPPGQNGLAEHLENSALPADEPD